MRVLLPTLVASSLGVLFCCASPESDSRFERHFVPQVWGDAFVRNVSDPVQVVPEAAGLAALPLLLMSDKTSSPEFIEDDTLTRGNTTTGTTVMTAMAASSVAVGGIAWAAGDDAELLEVCAESFAVTGILTESLKVLVHRQRPTSSAHDSFPSGHTSLAFSAAAFLGRALDEAGDEWYYSLGYTAYLPASYVALTRVEGGRHYMSDAVAGAVLGMLTTHVIFNAHIGSHGRKDATIFAPGSGAGVRASFEPLVRDDGLGVGLVLRF